MGTCFLFSLFDRLIWGVGWFLYCWLGFYFNEAHPRFLAVGFTFLLLHQLLNCLPQASETYLSDKE